MKGKRKFVIAISVLSVALVVAIGSIIGILAAFNASIENGFNVSLNAGVNVEAEVSCKTFTSLVESAADYNLMTYGTVVKTSDNKDFISFSQEEDQGIEASKSFKNIDIDKNRIDDLEHNSGECLYVTYVFKNTGEAKASVKIENKLTCENMSVAISYASCTGETEMNLSGLTTVNGETIELDAEKSVIIVFCFTPSVLTQNAGIAGSLVFALTASVVS